MIVGVDVGNSTTEVTLAEVINARLVFHTSGIAGTTGLKGTKDNVPGIIKAIKSALNKTHFSFENISIILINEATPVIGDFAMETITETVITESTLIGHNPDTPGGIGIGIGKTVLISELLEKELNERYILVIPETFDFQKASKLINKALDIGCKIEGLIVQKDEGVLIQNRIDLKIPIIDEVIHINKIPLNMECAVEVAPIGYMIEFLSNPYEIVNLFKLTSQEKKRIIPIAKALIGLRSAVVIRTPKGDIKERKINAGKLYLYTESNEYSVSVDGGANAIMQVMKKIHKLKDVKGEAGTSISGMIGNIKNTMAKFINVEPEKVTIKDLLAVDTFLPQKVHGGLSDEYANENSVGIAAMVKTEKVQMEQLANKLSNEINGKVEIGGVEGDMAIFGALTTPGTEKPLAVIDIGAGSVDASIMSNSGKMKAVHLAGAGDMVTMLINSELGINDLILSEEIKKNPVAKVESLFHIRHENGSIEFFEEPVNVSNFGKVVIVKEKELIPIHLDISTEKIRNIRREAKRKVIIQNSLRALNKLSPTESIRYFTSVVLVGGTALDFELPNMLTEVLAKYKIIAGRGNIRGVDGPRSAVSTGLLLNYHKRVIDYGR